jgi:hypothetical protein
MSQTKNNGGRPKKAVKRETITGVRFTTTEYFIVKNKATKSGLRITQFIRQMAIEGQVFARLTPEERNFIRQLVGMANNLNQLAKAANGEGTLTAMFYFEKYVKEIDELLNQLKGQKKQKTRHD